MLLFFVQKAQAFGLLVIAEDENSKTLLVHEIIAKDEYYMRSGNAGSAVFLEVCLLCDLALGSGGGTCC